MLDVITRAHIEEIVPGISGDTIQRWVTTGMLEPAIPASGSGHFRAFSRMQALAIAFAYGRRREGASLNAVAAYLARIGSMDEEQMLAALRENRTHLFPAPPYHLVKPWGGADPTEYNLATVYYRVDKKLKEIGRRPVKVGQGHRRSQPKLEVAQQH